MPKSEIDYSNTIIYKITCKDTNIKDIYVGHTTNFVQRKHAHKQSCINDKSFNYKCKLYEVIRNNGGWQNWKMEIVNFFNCLDHYEARKKEQEYFLSLNATLNSIEPMPIKKPKEIIIKNTIIKETFFCEKCNIKFNNLDLLEKHKKTIKHNKNNIIKKTPKNADIFLCEICDFNCCKKSNYDIHILTSKHIKANNANNSNIKKDYKCNSCGLILKHLSSLSRHKKKCLLIKTSDLSFTDSSQSLINENIIIKDASANEIKVLTGLVLELVKSNNDLQKQVLDVCKNIQPLSSII